MTIDTHFRFSLRHTSFTHTPASKDVISDPITTDIYLERADGSYSIVSLPELQQKQLYRYLADPPTAIPFDCGCFVQHMFDLPVTPDTFDFSLFTKQEYDHPSAVPVGAALVQYDPQTKAPLHFAISLGENIFLFKSGWRQSNKLTVATFESMAEVYGSYHAKILSPVCEGVVLINKKERTE
jgi:hypothetical protein